jgi:hypothetical protein
MLGPRELDTAVGMAEYIGSRHPSGESVPLGGHGAGDDGGPKVVVTSSTPRQWKAAVPGETETQKQTAVFECFAAVT